MSLTKLSGSELNGGSWVAGPPPTLSALTKLAGSELRGGSWTIATVTAPPRGFRHIGLVRGARG